jgi:hypothetical protein
LRHQISLTLPLTKSIPDQIMAVPSFVRVCLALNTIKPEIHFDRGNSNRGANRISNNIGPKKNKKRYESLKPWSFLLNK